MDDLIKALQIMRKYTDTRYPTNCDHDIMIFNVDVTLVSEEDINELEKLGVKVGEQYGDLTLYSYRYGSC